ncbi:MAG: hypothetical protein JSS76_09815 [Bacteroidetes bacterium]|nr:hypothetical protein [Bacteroidota bacterium]
MKKILIALVFAATTATAFAGTYHTAPVLTAEQRVTYEVRSQLIIPPVLMEVPGDYRAEVHFHIADGGRVAVDEVVSDNEILVKSLRNQLRGYTVSTEGLDTKSSYKVNVTFRVAAADRDNY